MAEPPVDLEAVGRHLGARVKDDATITVGGSKLNRRILVDGRSAVLTCGPTEGLATAHDIGREHACLVAMAGTPVPVPPVLGYCSDPSVAGAPFLITGVVEGACLLTEPDAPIDPVALAAAAVDVLAAVHATPIDEDAVPSSEGSYTRRQIHRWRRQLEATPTSGRLGDLSPLVDWMLAHAPEHEERTLVHGDYGFHNLLVVQDRITAVVDWELATMGDPLADLVFFTKAWGRGALTPNAANDAVALRPGVMDRREMEDRYARATGRAPSAHQPFYDVFSLWRSIGIREGLFARSGGTRFVEDAPGFVAVARRLADID